LKTKTDFSLLKLHFQLGDHDAGGPFCKNLMQHLTEEEIQEIEAQITAQVMDMEGDDGGHIGKGQHQHQACCAPLRSLSHCC
jgi:hypothetical protein